MSDSRDTASPNPPRKPDVRPAAGDPLAPIQSATLLQGRDAIAIEHNGRVYQLRKTKQGKLILTK